MSGDNIERGIVKDLLCMILLRMGNGEVIEIMTMGSTSVEKYKGKDFVAMRMVAPIITRTHQEHQIFEDMMPMEDIREPPMEENSVDKIESQVPRNNEDEEEEPVRSQGEDLHEREEVEEGVDQEEEEEPGSDGSSGESSDRTILLPKKRKRRTFEIPLVNDDDEEDTRISKKRKVEEIREWTDDDGEVEDINLISESESEEEDCPIEEPQENERNRCCEDSAKEESSHMDQNPRKRRLEEDPGDEDHNVKRRKEFESWKDLEELMRARVVRGNCKRGDKGPSDRFADM